MASYHAWKIANPNVPPLEAIDITPSDSADIETTAPNGDTIIGVRRLRARTAGTVRVTTAFGSTRDLEFAAGEMIDICVSRVHEAGTTVTVDSTGTGIEGYI